MLTALSSMMHGGKSIKRLFSSHALLPTADHRIVNVLHQYLRSSVDVTAGEDGLEDTRPIDQLVAVVKEIFQDRCTMLKFLFSEFRRWGGRQFLNLVFFERTG